MVQLVTLPVELDASFRKAAAAAEAGYLETTQVPAARQILRAAAWTYVAASLASLLNFWRWMAILRTLPVWRPFVKTGLAAVYRQRTSVAPAGLHAECRAATNAGIDGLG